MASLTGQTIASTYDALLKISDNGPINGTLKQITDGLGNTSPLYLSGNTVSVDGSFRLTGRLFDKNNESGIAGQFLVSSGDGVDWQNIAESGLITGLGTASFLSKFTASGVIANSIVSESGSGIGIGIVATQKLHVDGNGLFTGTLNSSNLSGSSSGTNTGDETNGSIKSKLGQVSPSNDGYLGSVDYESFLNKVPQTRTITINGESFDLSANRTYSVNVGVTSFNTRTGSVSLSSLDVTNALGYTPAIDSRIMTINGVGYSLAADRTWSVGTVTSVGTSAPLTGGTITGSGTIGINQSNTTTDGYLSSTDWNIFNNKQANLGYTPENLANKGINNGYASLGGDGKVPSTQLPSYVDDVVEVANFAALPATGETGKIYVTLDTDFVYRWSGTVYVRISSPNAIWGSITGTLSNQIDLQNALNAKVSSVGLDLGTSGTDVNVANSPITSSGNITLNLPTASATNRGLLSSSDWSTFNNKQNALTLTTTGTSGASTLVGSTLNIPQYQPQLNGTGFVKISGTTISYDNNTYLTTSSAASTYLPLIGGTLTGALNGTSATFSSTLLTTGTGSNTVLGGTGLKVTSSNTGLYLNFSPSFTGGVEGEISSSENGLRIVAAGSGQNTMRFLTSNSSGVSTLAMAIDGRQNLGLGVTPSAWFSTVKAFQFSTTGSLWAVNGQQNTILSTNDYIDSAATARYIENGNAMRYQQINGAHSWQTAPNNTSGAGAAISFTQAMILTAAGRLLINTPTESTYQLDVNGTGRLKGGLTIIRSNTSESSIITNEGNLIYNARDGFNHVFQSNGTEIARISSTGAATFSSSVTVNDKLLVNVSSQISAGKINCNLLGGTDDGMCFRNTNSGNTGSYIAFFNSANGLAGVISHTGALTVAYTTSSDYRLKENITPMTGALDIVALLKPVTYNWKIDGSNGQGFIAHELAEIVPEAVVGQKDAIDKDGKIKPQGIDTSFLVATLTAAIQEQQIQINELKAEIELLKNK